MKKLVKKILIPTAIIGGIVFVTKKLLEDDVNESHIDLTLDDEDIAKMAEEEEKDTERNTEKEVRKPIVKNPIPEKVAKEASSSKDTDAWDFD